MTVNAKKPKFNFAVFAGYTFSVLFSVACYLIYSRMPVMESFTNSTEYSGLETVKMFSTSFISGIISATLFIAVAFSGRKYFFALSKYDSKIGKIKLKDSVLEWISVTASLVVLAVLIVSTVLAFLYYNECISMKYPFLAPTDNTVYKTYEYVILAMCIVHFVFYMLTVVKMLGIKWLDAIATAICGVIDKSKEKQAEYNSTDTIEASEEIKEEETVE